MKFLPFVLLFTAISLTAKEFHPLEDPEILLHNPDMGWAFLSLPVFFTG